MTDWAVSSTSRHWGREGSTGGTVGGQNCDLDALGNWLKYNGNGIEDTRTHNSVNELTSRTAGGTLSYDDNGNMVDNGTSYKCIYDYRNRLIEVTRQNDTSIAKYYYDGNNRRIRKTVYDTDGSTELSDTRYIYNGGWQVIEERDYDSSELEARYVYGNEYIDEPVVMYRDGNSDEDFDETNEILYYLQDRLYNVVALTNVEGAIVERIKYEPYGRATCRRASDNNEQVASHFGNPYQFTGRRVDDETCLYHYRNRYYSAALGRFISRDPSGYISSMNLYQYVQDNPTRWADSFGLMEGDVRYGGFVAGPVDIKTLFSDFNEDGASVLAYLTYDWESVGMAISGCKQGSIDLKFTRTKTATISSTRSYSETRTHVTQQGITIRGVSLGSSNSTSTTMFWSITHSFSYSTTIEVNRELKNEDCECVSLEAWVMRYRLTVLFNDNDYLIFDDSAQFTIIWYTNTISYDDDNAKCKTTSSACPLKRLKPAK